MTNPIENVGRRNKPVGIVLIALFGAAWGLLAVVSGIWIMIAVIGGPWVGMRWVGFLGVLLCNLPGPAWGLGSVITVFLKAAYGESAGFGLGLVGILLLPFGLLSLAAYRGLWLLAEWARKLEITLSAISIPLGLISLAGGLMLKPEGDTGDIIIDVVNIAVAVWIVWYLSTSNVKALFSEAKSSAGSQSFADIPISRFCTQCGHRLEAGLRFCPSCGSAVEQ